jgi:broad specificity phosphatase PhoE
LRRRAGSEAATRAGELGPKRKFNKEPVPLISVVLATLLYALTFQPARITFVRHSETVANATGRYNSRTLNAFSERGITQTTKLTKQLAGASFDQVLVSPSPRALKTIAPWLARTQSQAEVWPELLECCHQRGVARQTPPAPTVRFADNITWPDAFEGLFKHRPGGERLIAAPTYQDGIRQIHLAHSRLLRSFSGTGKHVLVVGHSIQGGKMIALLTGKQIQLQNAKPVNLVETKPGHFSIN